jgi:hypothetical protein
MPRHFLVLLLIQLQDINRFSTLRNRSFSRTVGPSLSPIIHPSLEATSLSLPRDSPNRSRTTAPKDRWYGLLIFHFQTSRKASNVFASISSSHPQPTAVAIRKSPPRALYSNKL